VSDTKKDRKDADSADDVWDMLPDELIGTGSDEEDALWKTLPENPTQEEMSQFVASLVALKKKQGETSHSSEVCIRCNSSVGPLGYWKDSKRVLDSEKNQQGVTVECTNFVDCNKRKYPYSGTTTYVDKCRHEATAAYYLGSTPEETVTFYGGSQSKVEGVQFGPEWLVVSLLGTKRDRVIWSPDSIWAESLSKYIYGPTMSIDWPDMQAPPLRPGFWSAFLDTVRDKAYTDVLFYCFGGHGRTGTALASVLVECYGTPATDAVKFIRKHYCKEAVETESQLNYLKLLESTAKSTKPAAAKTASRRKEKKNV
jgi:hypothetical protein